MWGWGGGRSLRTHAHACTPRNHPHSSLTTGTDPPAGDGLADRASGAVHLVRALGSLRRLGRDPALPLASWASRLAGTGYAAFAAAGALGALSASRAVDGLEAAAPGVGRAPAAAGLARRAVAPPQPRLVAALQASLAAAVDGDAEDGLRDPASAARALGALGRSGLRERGLLHRTLVPALARCAARAATEMRPSQVKTCLTAASQLNCRSLDLFSALAGRASALTEVGSGSDDPTLMSRLPPPSVVALTPAEAAHLAGGFGANGYHPGDALMRLACQTRLEDDNSWALRGVVEAVAACAALDHPAPATLVADGVAAISLVFATMPTSAAARHAHALARLLSQAGALARPWDGGDGLGVSALSSSGAPDDDDGAAALGDLVEPPLPLVGRISSEEAQVATLSSSSSPPPASSLAPLDNPLYPTQVAVHAASELIAASTSGWLPAAASRPRDLSRVVWAVARLSCLPGAPASPRRAALLDAVARDCARPGVLSSFDPQSLSMLLWSFARVGYSSGPLGRALLEAAAVALVGDSGTGGAGSDDDSDSSDDTPAIPRVLADQDDDDDPIGGRRPRSLPRALRAADPQVDPQSLAMLLWAFARLGFHPGRAGMRLLTDAALAPAALGRSNAQGLCMILWAHAELATGLGPRELALIGEELRRQRAGLGPVAAASLASTAARLRWADTTVLDLVPFVCVHRADSFSPDAVATTLYGLARAGYRLDRPALNALCCRGRATSHLFGAQAAVNTLWALAACGGAPEATDYVLASALVDRLETLLREAEPHPDLDSNPDAPESSTGDGAPAAQLLCHALWATGTLGLDPGPGFVRLTSARLAVARPGSMSPSEACMASWGLATMGYGSPGGDGGGDDDDDDDSDDADNVIAVTDADESADPPGAEDPDTPDAIADWLAGTAIEAMADEVYSSSGDAPLSVRDAAQLGWSLVASGLEWHPAMAAVARRVRDARADALEPLSSITYPDRFSGNDSRGSFDDNAEPAGVPPGRLGAVDRERRRLLGQLRLAEALSAAAHARAFGFRDELDAAALASARAFVLTLPPDVADAAARLGREAAREAADPGGASGATLAALEAAGGVLDPDAAEALGRPVLDLDPLVSSSGDGQEPWRVVVLLVVSPRQGGGCGGGGAAQSWPIRLSGEDAVAAELATLGAPGRCAAVLVGAGGGDVGVLAFPGAVRALAGCSLAGVADADANDDWTPPAWLAFLPRGIAVVELDPDCAGGGRLCRGGGERGAGERVI